MLTVYGIPNCNTVKKARTWLDEHKVAYTFHDYKKKGIIADKLKSWSEVFNWEKLVNKAGTTWKALSEEEKAAVNDLDAAVELMTDKTSVIKRPLIEDESGRAVLLGFSEAEYQKALLS
ncbi:MAG TPA: ArsC family reductase [Dyadobacter sp.]|jgi:arsenate reductase|nr:ArsC family reductase [Dyadobacter sp.]